jgi:23S rRNA (pseudouridine1915-N3)-methyltransferase
MVAPACHPIHRRANLVVRASGGDRGPGREVAVRWVVAAVGKIKEPHFREAIAEYRSRLVRYRPFDLVEVSEERLVPGRETLVMRQEAERLRAALPPGPVVMLSERGKAVTTHGLVERLARFEQEGHASLSFVLGGPCGLDPAWLESASWTWSLSPLTMPFALARVVVLEQLYRAETIRRREPYHKD